MRVVHTVGWYFPESTGGTEVYVGGLVAHLKASGVDVRIGAATSAGAPADYEWHGVPVHRYPVPEPTRDAVRAMAPPSRLDEFEAWLADEQADIYHQHSWVHGCGLDHLRVAKGLGLRTVLTVHVPGVVCLRGTMLLDGEAPCDGRVAVDRCTRCWGATRGVPEPLRSWQATHPGASTTLARLLPFDRPARAFSTPALVDRHLTRLHEAIDLSDRVVAVAHWLHDALAHNGAPASKLVYCAQGLASQPAPARLASGDGPLRVGFLGRLDPQKGVHVVIDAIRRAPDLDAVLSVHGLAFDDDYRRRLVELAGTDPRIRFERPVPREQVHTQLGAFDVLAVPSLGFETGPLVALEALASGTPVFGSPWGGIPELVANVAGCRLIPAGDVDAWRDALSDAAAHRPARVSVSPRTSSNVATETLAMYASLMCAPGAGEAA